MDLYAPSAPNTLQGDAKEGCGADKIHVDAKYRLIDTAHPHRLASYH